MAATKTEDTESINPKITEFERLPFGSFTPFGLNNCGATCFFNTAIQSLMSSYHFCRNLVTNDYYKQILEDEKKANDRYINPKLQKLFRNYMSKILMGEQFPEMGGVLLSVLGEKAVARENAHGFESTNESIRLLINELDLEDFFMVKYDIYRDCKECEYHSKTEAKDRDSNIIITMFDTDIDHDPNKNFETNMIERIKKTESDLPDFKCPNCGKKGTCRETRKLQFLSECVIVVFNKYQGNNPKTGQPYTVRHNLHPPLKLEFINKDGEKRIFKAVSLVEHIGGHYYAIVKRGDKVFLCSDTSIHIVPELKTDENTYIIIYEVE